MFISNAPQNPARKDAVTHQSSYTVHIQQARSHPRNVTPHHEPLGTLRTIARGRNATKVDPPRPAEPSSCSLPQSRVRSLCPPKALPVPESSRKRKLEIIFRIQYVLVAVGAQKFFRGTNKAKLRACNGANPEARPTTNDLELYMQYIETVAWVTILSYVKCPRCWGSLHHSRQSKRLQQNGDDNLFQ